MRVSLLTIGDELLIGQVLNSNVQWMSEHLTDVQASVTHHLSVGDDPDSILNALRFLTPSSDAIIIGGGLGPTHDDITMEVLSQFIKKPLVYDKEWIHRVSEFFKSRGRVMTENNKKQGYLLPDAIRIDNDCGTAAGQHFRFENTDFFVVPGVPHEMQSMMNRYILPTLSEKSLNQGERILKATLLTTGVGESALAERCDAFVKKIKTIPNLTLAFLPSSTQVRLRLQTKVSTSNEEIEFKKLVEELKACCKDDFYGFEPANFEDLLVRTLQGRKQTLALAESCTGGYASHRMTQVTGSSEVFRGAIVSYQECIKEQELQISKELITQNGPVSEPVAIAMAEGIRKKWKSTYGIGITGYLGENGGDAFSPSGSVWIALSTPTQTIARNFRFEKDRKRGKERAAQAALDLLRRNLNDQN